LERLLDDISFTAPDRTGETLVITEADVMTKVAGLAANVNLSKFVL
jgi:ATP-dependent HslUV protease ATP-binding subunit HslU